MTRYGTIVAMCLIFGGAAALPGCSDDDDQAADTGVVKDAGTAVDTGTVADGAADMGDISDASVTLYAPCTFDPQPVCGASYDQCYVLGGGSAPHYCTYLCETAATCPVPTSGTATLICDVGNEADKVCQLDCSDGTCPTGMTCVATGASGQDMRCAYNP